MQVLFNLTRRSYRFAIVAERLKRLVELLPAFFQPVLDLDVVVAAVTLIRIQLVGAVNRDCLSHLSEEFFEVDDVVALPTPISSMRKRFTRKPDFCCEDLQQAER